MVRKSGSEVCSVRVPHWSGTSVSPRTARPGAAVVVGLAASAGAASGPRTSDAHRWLSGQWPVIYK